MNLIQGMLDSKSHPSIAATEPKYFRSEGNLLNFEQTHLTKRGVVNIVEQTLGRSQRGNNQIRNRNFDRNRFSSNRTTTGEPVCTRCHRVGHIAPSCNWNDLRIPARCPGYNNQFTQYNRFVQGRGMAPTSFNGQGRGFPVNSFPENRGNGYQFQPGAVRRSGNPIGSSSIPPRGRISGYQVISCPEPVAHYQTISLATPESLNFASSSTIPCSISKIAVECLIDRGAGACTIYAEKFYQIPSEQRPTLIEGEVQEIKTVSGELVTVLGTAIIELT